jgi:hypothetical protein
MDILLALVWPHDKSVDNVVFSSLVLRSSCDRGQALIRTQGEVMHR